MIMRMHEVVTPFLETKSDWRPNLGVRHDEHRRILREAFVVPPMVELLKPMAGEIDGVVVGCFDDTGVDHA